MVSLESETAKDGFWNDADNSSKLFSKLKKIQKKISTISSLENELNNLIEMNDLLLIETAKGKSTLNRKLGESLITLFRNEFLHQSSITKFRVICEFLLFLFTSLYFTLINNICHLCGKKNKKIKHLPISFYYKNIVSLCLHL